MPSPRTQVNAFPTKGVVYLGCESGKEQLQRPGEALSYQVAQTQALFVPHSSAPFISVSFTFDHVRLFLVCN